MEEKTRFTLDELRTMEADSTEWGYRVWRAFHDEKLVPIGFSGAAPRWSGFWSQGDGASFTGRCTSTHVPGFVKTVLGAEALLPLEAQCALEGSSLESELVNGVSIELYQCTHQYAHENTVGIQITPWGELECVDEFLQKHSDELLKYLRGLMREFYNALEEEYEYVTSEEYLRELAEANDWEIVE